MTPAAIPPRPRTLTPVSFAVCLIATLVPAPAVRAQSIVPTGAQADEQALITARGERKDVRIGRHAAAANVPFMQWGPVAVRPSLRYTGVYADGLPAALGQRVSSHIHTVTPALVLASNRGWMMEYAASWITYTNDAFRDTVSHYAVLQAQLVRAGWSAVAGTSYGRTDSPLVQSGRQSKQESSNTYGSASIELASDWTLDVAAEQNLMFIERLSDTLQWAVRPEVSYHLPSITIGAAFESGYVLVYDASDLEYYRPFGHATWRPTTRTSIDVQVGWDDWNFVSGDQAGVSGLYYRGTAALNPFQHTRIALSAERVHAAAPYRNQTTENEHLSLTFRQRLFTHFDLEFTAAELKTDYAAGSEPFVPRVDRIRSYGARLALRFLQRGTASLFYRYARNTSTSADYRFSSHQTGIELSYRY